MPNWASQNPEQFGWQRMPNAALLPFSYRGYAFPQGVAAGTVPIWTKALDRLTAAGWRLPPNPDPFESGMWGAANRKKGSGNGWSFHAYGLALDLAAPWNPAGLVAPKPSAYRLPDNTGALVRDLGILWGADFAKVPDWMHLELHLSPAELAGVIGTAVRGDRRPPFPLPVGHYYGPRRTDQPRSISGGYSSIPAAWREGLIAAQRALGVAPDGIYGPRTAAAAVERQRRAGLVPDGLIGAKTWGALFPA